MYLKKIFPHVVTGYIIAVGLFFGVSALVKGALLDPQPPGSHFLTVLSTIFICIGIYSIYLLNRGRLSKSGKSIAEVRKESVTKMNDTSLLARIAMDDQNAEVRKTAEKRLKELKD